MRMGGRAGHNESAEESRNGLFDFYGFHRYGTHIRGARDLVDPRACLVV